MKEKSANTNTLSVGGEGKSAKDSHHSLLSTMADPDISLLSLAKFVLSQNGTNHLQNVNNFTYRDSREECDKEDGYLSLHKEDVCQLPRKCHPESGDKHYSEIPPCPCAYVPPTI
jgi:hypothetical protein